MPSIYNMLGDLLQNKIILNLFASFNHYFTIALAFIITFSLSASLLGSFFFDWGSSPLTGTSSFSIQ